MKIFAWTNVLIRLLIVDLFFRVLAIVVYVPIYILRNPIRWFRKLPIFGWIIIPLWIFLDDTGDYGNQEECWNIVGCKPDTIWHKFKCAYYWSGIRNIAWNSYQFKFFQGVNTLLPSTDYNFINCNNYTYDNKLNLEVSNNCDTRMNRAKFYSINPDGSHSVSSNDGVYLDLEKSLFGKTKYYFKNNGKWWVLYTYCEITKIKNNIAYITEFNIGANGRVLFRHKWQHALI